MTTKFQVSTKLPDGRIFVIGGDTFDEYYDNLRLLYGGEDEKAIAAVTAMQEAFSGQPVNPIQNAVAQIQHVMPAQVMQEQASGWPAGAQPVRQSAGPAPAANGKQCIHGPMTYRTGVGAKGPWAAHFCPTPKGTPDQCAPTFIKAR